MTVGDYAILLGRIDQREAEIAALEVELRTARARADEYLRLARIAYERLGWNAHVLGVTPGNGGKP